ncbi:MAG: hypothetical protein FWF94_04555 [Oscillospiraceae bacterium]|nr:hypothetical protein [Oscillospiraceae bacterium]
MQKPFVKLLLSGLGYMLMGNLLSVIMSVSLAFFRGETLIMILSVLFGIAIYLLLVAVPAYKDGLDENAKQKKRKDNTESVPKWRWALVGTILWGVMLIPSVVYLFTEYNEGVYRMLNGAVFPLSAFMLVSTMTTEYPFSSAFVEVLRLAPFAPYVFMGVYALTIPACHIGFILGLNNGLDKDKIMYEKQ